MGDGLRRSASCAIHCSIPYIRACERSGGVSSLERVVDKSTIAISRADEISSFGHRMMCSSVSSCRVLQCGHRLLIELSHADRFFLVGVNLCCSFVIRVWRCCGMRLMVRPIAVQDIASNIVSFHSVFFSSIRLRSCPCAAVKRMNLE